MSELLYVWPTLCVATECKLARWHYTELGRWNWAHCLLLLPSDWREEGGRRNIIEAMGLR